MPVKRTPSGEPYMDPGKMRARITFLEQSIVDDASGKSARYAAGSPPDVTRAEITSVSGTDVIKSGQDVAQVKIVATIRYKPPGRKSTMRFQDRRGNVYVIQAVRDLDPGRIVFQELVCLQLGANA